MVPYPMSESAIATLLKCPAPVLFFDSARPSYSDSHSYLFHDPIRILSAFNAAELDRLLDSVERVTENQWVAGFFTYEAGLLLEPKLRRLFNGSLAGFPLAWFGVFDSPRIVNHSIRGQGELDSALDRSTCLRQLSPMPGMDEYASTLRTIHEYLEQGDTYQVNYTFPRLLSFAGAAHNLYLQLRRTQPVAYSAYVDTGSNQILSFSPELFFERKGMNIRVKPMKGTALRRGLPEEDRLAALTLEQDPKNRAENVMIVDMLRNDLGRICRTGTVTVERLFQVEAHPTVFQMTSTVLGELVSSTGLATVLKALFPCGSVTGAPKIRTMEIIDEIESVPRGVYCGALGFAGPANRAVFSVPIRTLQRATSHRSKSWIYGVGSGIVADSNAADEWVECETKCAFLTTFAREFRLVESLLWDGRYRYANLHLRRMHRSAEALGFPFSRFQYSRKLAGLARGLERSKAYKVRLLLDRTGVWSTEVQELKAAERTVVSACLELDDGTIDNNEMLLYHKTTYRPWYANAAKRIVAGQCYEVAFFNTQGYVTEGARSNIFVELDGQLYTPPLASGLLGGVLREWMLAHNCCQERILTREELVSARRIYCGNSVRGLVEVYIDPGGKVAERKLSGTLQEGFRGRNS